MRSEAAFCFRTESCRIIQNGTACKCRNPRCAGCSRKDEMQVMIHLDQGGRYFYLKEWFDCSFEAGLEDFDLIGLSYYPFWHGTFTDLKETMTKLIQDCKSRLWSLRRRMHGERVRMGLSMNSRKNRRISGDACRTEAGAGSGCQYRCFAAG